VAKSRQWRRVFGNEVAALSGAPARLHTITLRFDRKDNGNLVALACAHMKTSCGAGRCSKEQS